MSASEFERALNGRPVNFRYLDPETQWAIDKNLGILDWEGDCRHGTRLRECDECSAEWDAKYGDKNNGNG